MNAKIISIFITVLIVVGGGAFYGGMKCAQNKSPLSQFSRQNFQNLSSEQRQQFLQGNAAGAIGRGMAGGLLSGEVMAKDGESLTIKTPDGSSRIIFVSGSTAITKTTQGSIGDIKIGEQIMVSGLQNSDGSYTAQSIQGRDLPLQNSNR